MYHTCLYTGTVAASDALTSLSVSTDGGDIVSNGQYFPNRDLDLLGVYAASAGITRSIVNTPTLRSVAGLQVRPVRVGALPGTNTNFSDLTRNPVVMKNQENIDMQAAKAGAGTEAGWAVLFLGNGRYNMASGPRYKLRGTGTTTLTANAWSNVAVTWDFNIQQGWYEIQGIEVVSATAIAARLVVPNYYYRPGVTGLATVGERLPSMFYDGRFGPAGRFNTVALPGLSVWATSADTAQTIWLDLVKVAGPDSVTDH